ncbi:MAG: amidohydrolase family protein [Myxococcales bacterium]|nr:amidohydrolase family protein [Myxococcales bacterium]
MGHFGEYVIDADGHGGEPLEWRRRVPDRFRSRMEEYTAEMKAVYRDLPGGGVRADPAGGEGARDAVLEGSVPMRPGMYEPAARLDDMDLEGIDVAVLYPPGSGEEWALGDPDFSEALCRTLNDARAEYASYAPDRLKLVAKLPMIDPQRAARELERCVSEHDFVGMVTATHIRDRNLDDPGFDVVWETAERLGVAVCTHGGGQAPGQTPVAIDRFHTRLGVHAITHPLGGMQAVYHFTVGGILARFPKLRVGFMEAALGWLPFWLERLDEHWELMPEQAPEIDRKPSEYFLGRCFLTAEPEDRMLPYVAEALDAGIVCYASDYCHWDCAFPDSVKILVERDDLSGPVRRQLFCENAARLYALEVPAVA